MSNITAVLPNAQVHIPRLNVKYLVSFLLLNASLAFTQAPPPVVQNDFEDGTVQGWIPRGTAMLSNTTEAAHTGTHSLKTIGRTAGFNGPSLNILGTLHRGDVYQVTAWVRLVAGETADQLKITVQRTPSGGSTAFDQVTPLTNVTDAGWVMLQGQYSFAADVTGLLLYIEAAGANTKYYVDDFSIIKVPAQGCAVPQDNSGIHTDFESNTTQGWRPRIGRETVTVTSADAHTGTYSLLTTGRQRTFDGPSINAAGKLCNGSRYKVTVWVKMAPGQPSTQIRLSLQRSLNGGQPSFNTVIGDTLVTANNWVRLKGTYDFAFNYDSLSLYVESNNNASFYIDDFDVTFVPAPVIEANIPSVYQALSDDFPFGAAIWSGDLTGVHAQLLTKHVNSVTSENDMKWDATERSENSFSYATADAQVAFARANNIKVRGHTLVWHSQVPPWVFQDANGVDMSNEPFNEGNKALLLSRMRNHIRNLVQHFGADVYAWDVVNEAFDESQQNGFRTGSSNPPSKWYQIVGSPEFIDDAFIYARQALDETGITRDQVKLCYNDFSTTVPKKRDFIYNYLKDALARGIPIDCVGQQFHNNLNFPIDDAGSAPSKRDVIDAIDKFASLGLTNHITEFDISIYRVNAPNQTIYHDYDDIVAFDQPDLILLGYRYRDYFDIFKNLKDKISSVTLWGHADDHTWRTSGTTVNAPLLFDVNLQHKYAYTGVIDPLDLPGADVAVSISTDSGTVLSGHNLNYGITVTNNGHDSASNIVLTDALPSGAVFQSLIVPANWTCSTPVAGNAGQVRCTTASMKNGDVAQFALTAQLACAIADGTHVNNSATVASDTLDPNLAPNNTASIAIQVSNPPPVISDLSVTPAVLWPPNHKMVDAILSYNITDNCDAGLVPAIAITSNESTNGTGDGNTSTDWQVIDAHHVQLRAERAGTGTDRIYTISLTATDSAGSSTSSSTIVTVPHN